MIPSPGRGCSPSRAFPPQKGLDLALLAALILKKRGYSFRWYIIGVGPEEADLRDQAEALGLNGHRLFPGGESQPLSLCARVHGVCAALAL